MSRKQRIDSSTAAVKVMASALTELLPPEHCPLPEAAMPFWRRSRGGVRARSGTQHRRCSRRPPALPGRNGRSFKLRGKCSTGSAA
jgi:hypothetical protein